MGLWNYLSPWKHLVVAVKRWNINSPSGFLESKNLTGLKCLDRRTCWLLRLLPLCLAFKIKKIKIKIQVSRHGFCFFGFYYWFLFYPAIFFVLAIHTCCSLKLDVFTNICWERTCNWQLISIAVSELVVLTWRLLLLQWCLVLPPLLLQVHILFLLVLF